MWSAALAIWVGQFLPPGPVGDMAFLAILWTALHAVVTGRGLPLTSYWMALAIGFLAVGALGLVAPSVPRSIRITTTAAILLVRYVLVLWRRARRALQNRR